MPSNLLILPLLGGYFFLHILAFTKYRSQRLDGHRLLLESALMAILLSAIGRISAYILWHLSPIQQLWSQIAPPFEFFGTALLSVAAGVVTPFALNALAEKVDRFERIRRLLGKIRVYSKRRALSAAMLRHGSELHRLLYTAMDQERQVAVTLDNKKVYIGYISGAPKLEPHDAYVALIPLLSGYREASSMDLKLTQDYLSVYAADPDLRKENFVVVLPLSQIRMASFFEQAAYTKFEIVKSGAASTGTAMNSSAEVPIRAAGAGRAA